MHEKKNDVNTCIIQRINNFNAKLKQYGMNTCFQTNDRFVFNERNNGTDRLTREHRYVGYTHVQFIKYYFFKTRDLNKIIPTLITGLYI